MILPAALILSRLGGAIGAKPLFPSFFSGAGAPLGVGEENAYEKYDSYPPYCSTPDEMEKRAVPPLQSDGNVSSRLVHVTALIRHGARTPYDGAPDYRCWNGFWDDEETGVWDCDLKTYISPPAVTKGKGRVADGEGVIEEDPDFLFEKRYDALVVGPGRTGNNLNGTCQLGQLISRGYDQELQNGQHLRQAYFYDGDKTANKHAASDPRMRLWDLADDDAQGREKASNPIIGDPAKQIFQELNLRYRADDEQRTLMSGQILLRGLFEQELLSIGDVETAVIRLHTADYHLDVLGINHDTCPRANDLYNEAYESDDYKKWIENSIEAKTVASFLKEELNLDEMPSTMLDCLMTTICTDRTLPAKLNDYDGSLGPTPWLQSHENLVYVAGEGESKKYPQIFEHIANVAIKNFTFPYKYNDAAYAKLGMGPLWKEIMANILPIIDPANHPPSGAPPPKLALFSGHDTTLMPILATLGDDVWSGVEWAPYASMIQVEIHEILDSEQGSEFPSGYAFRLIYNGKVLTSKMDGCNADLELCDSQLLKEQVMPFAKYQERDCVSTVPADPPATESLISEMESASSNLLAAPGGVWVFAALSVFSMMLGCAATCCFMRHRAQKNHGYRQSPDLGELSLSVMADGGNEHHFQPDDGHGNGIASHQDQGTRNDELKVGEDSLT